MKGESAEPTIVIGTEVGVIAVDGLGEVFETKRGGYRAVRSFAGKLDSETFGKVLHQIQNSNLPPGRPPVLPQ